MRLLTLFLLLLFTVWGVGTPLQLRAEPLTAPIDPRSFGAQPNDRGDDTAAIQQAIDAASWNGGRVLLSRGEYRLTETIGVQSRARYVGKLRQSLEPAANSLAIVGSEDLPGTKGLDIHGGLLLLRDDQASRNEIVRYSGVRGDVVLGLSRGAEGTEPGAFGLGRRVYVLSPALTALAKPLHQGETELALVDASGFPSQGWIVIGLEVIRYRGRVGNRLTGLARGRGSRTDFSGRHTDSLQAAHDRTAGVWKFPHEVMIEGEAGTTLVYEGLSHAIAFHGEDWPCMFYGGGVRQVRIVHQPPSRAEGSGIDVRNAHRLLLDRVEIVGFRFGIRLGERAWSNTLRDCLVEACQVSYQMGVAANSFLLEGCRSLYARQWSFDADGMTNGIIRDCSFEFGGPLRLRGHGLVLTGCRFDTIRSPAGLQGQAAVLVTGISRDPYFRTSYGTVVSDNYFSLDLASTVGIEVAQAEGTTIRGNLINGCREHGIAISRAAVRTHVDGNVMLEPGDAPHRAKSRNTIFNAGTETTVLGHNGDPRHFTDQGWGTRWIPGSPPRPE